MTNSALGAIINLQQAGEHRDCGDGLINDEFSYSPDEFMRANSMHLFHFSSLFFIYFYLYHLFSSFSFFLIFILIFIDIPLLTMLNSILLQLWMEGHESTPN